MCARGRDLVQSIQCGSGDSKHAGFSAATAHIGLEAEEAAAGPVDIWVMAEKSIPDKRKPASSGTWQV